MDEKKGSSQIKLLIQLPFVKEYLSVDTPSIFNNYRNYPFWCTN